MAKPLFANNATAVVTAGGTTAPAAGTSQSWTAGSVVNMPAAVTGVSQFSVADPLLPTELMTVTNVSGATWTVTRGAEGTTPVAHASGFTVYKVTSSGDLGTLVPSGPIVWPTGDTSGAADYISMLKAASSLPGGGTVTLAPGTFYTSTRLTVPANVTVAGVDEKLTILNVVGNVIAFLIQNVSNSGVRDMTINGNGTTQPVIYVNAGTATMTGISTRRVTINSAGYTGVSAISYAATGNPIQYPITCQLEDVTVVNPVATYAAGIFVSGTKGSTFTRCNSAGATGTGASGIFIASSTDFKVTDCEANFNTAHGLCTTFSCSEFTITGGHYCSNNASGTTGYGIIVSQGCVDFTIQGAVCKYNGASGIGADVLQSASYASGTATSGTTTTLTDTARHWVPNLFTGWALNITAGTGSGQNLTILSNTYDSITFATATAPDNTSQYTVNGGAYVYDCSGTITGNICSYNQSQGMWLQACANMTVTGNNVHHNVGMGIDTVALRATVTGNNIHDNGSYAVAAYKGSTLTCGGHRITGNSYHNNNSGGANVFTASTLDVACINDELNLPGATFTGWVAPAVVTLTDAPTVVVNAALGNDFRVTLTASGHTVGAPSNPVNGQDITFLITQPASGGPYTVTWASGTGGYSFGAGSAPTLSTAASATDMIAFKYRASASQWLCLGTAAGF